MRADVDVDSRLREQQVEDVSVVVVTERWRPDHPVSSLLQLTSAPSRRRDLTSSGLPTSQAFRKAEVVAKIPPGGSFCVWGLCWATLLGDCVV